MHSTPSWSRRPAQLGRVALVLLTFAALGAWLTPAGAGGAAGVPATAYVPGQVVIGWRAGDVSIPSGELSRDWTDDRASPTWQAAAMRVAALTGLPVLELQPAHRVALLAVRAGDELAASSRLQGLPWVAYAEPNFLARAADLPPVTPVYPDDPAIGVQWNVRRVDAPIAWAVTFGSYSIALAVIDSGVDGTHPEFAHRLLPGYDYVNGDNDPSDDNGHGTHVAGIAAASADNGMGIAGLAANVKILPLKVLDHTGSGSYNNIATAIERAADAGAQVINLSLGGVYPSERLRTAVNYAVTKGALLVAAAGNCAQGGAACEDRINPDFYPAAYPGALAVAASDHFDRWAKYSGYKAYVSLAAPGGVGEDPVWSTVPAGYGFNHGTSMAAPLVSAAAALVWTMMPVATAQQVTDVLLDTADQTGFDPDTGQPLPYTGGRNNYFGRGRLNAGRAVRAAYPPSLSTVSGPQTFLLGPPGTTSGQVLQLANPSAQTVWWQATVTAGSDWLAVSPATGSADFGRPALLALQAGPTTRSAGHHTGVLRVQPLFPTGIPTLEIPVELEIAPALRRNHLPLAAEERMAVRWIRGPWMAARSTFPTMRWSPCRCRLQ